VNVLNSTNIDYSRVLKVSFEGVHNDGGGKKLGKLAGGGEVAL
jgi:hypothetical protein